MTRLHSVRATILQTPRPGEMEVIEDQLVTIDNDGIILSVSSDDGPADVNLGEGMVLLPGLVDTHLHASQWPQLGTALDQPLERWLFDYTFPLEARYEDTAFALKVWDSMIPALLKSGTTTAVYYSSVHEPATLALAEACIAYGQRAFVGRVAMDHPDGTPEWYRDSGPNQSVAASHRSIEAIRSLPGGEGLVEPIITPRFIPACSDAALEGLGELAEATGALVQTHCSENDWEHNYVIERHGCTDAESLSSFGLVRNSSVLAHATHLSDADRRLLVEAGAGVAHCPLSNSYFANAVFPARRNIEAGLKIGLGSDIAGGSDPSMLAQCVYAVNSSRMLEDGVDVKLQTDRGVPESRIDIIAAFWMATVGGADLLGIPTGLLAPGRLFDAIAVGIEPSLSLGDRSETDGWEQIFEKVVRSGGIADIDTVWVGGVDVTNHLDASSK